MLGSRLESRLVIVDFAALMRETDPNVSVMEPEASRTMSMSFVPAAWAEEAVNKLANVNINKKIL
jgi:hypothetical protein